MVAYLISALFLTHLTEPSQFLQSFSFDTIGYCLRTQEPAFISTSHCRYLKNNTESSKSHKRSITQFKENITKCSDVCFAQSQLNFVFCDQGLANLALVGCSRKLGFHWLLIGERDRSNVPLQPHLESFQIWLCSPCVCTVRRFLFDFNAQDLPSIYPR